MSRALLQAEAKALSAAAEPNAAPSDAGVGIHIAAVAKSFGERVVFRDLSLEIGAGAFVAVVGRSGCGKTTRSCA